MKANSIEWRKMCDRLFYGVALTDEHMNTAHKELFDYLKNCNLAPLWDFLGLSLVESFTKENGRIISRRICFRDSGVSLTVRELENIGCFLPGNPWYKPEYDNLFMGDS